MNRTERYEQNLACAAKQILEIAQNQQKKYFAISGFQKTNRRKNKNVQDLAACIGKMGKKVLLINFDPQASFEKTDHVLVKSETAKVDGYSYHTAYGQDDSKNQFDLVLYNLLPVDANKAMFERQMFFDFLLLSVEYGRTRYENIETALEFLRSNEIELLGLLANQ